MSARLTSELLVKALIRRANAEAGFATVLHRGDPIAGIVLVQIAPGGRFGGFWERMTDLDGNPTLARCGPAENAEYTEIIDYIARRRRSDPDLWLIELDIANAERLAAEILAAG